MGQLRIKLGVLAASMLVLTTVGAMAEVPESEQGLLANLSPESTIPAPAPEAVAPPETPQSKAVALLLQSFHGNTDFTALSEALEASAAETAKAKAPEVFPKQVAADDSKLNK